jgi:outer membrane immunogenic protein
MLDLNVSEGTGRSGGGGFAGGQLGCNVQAGAIVWGIEGEAAWSGLGDHFHSGSVPSFNDDTTRNRWSADVAVRAGVAVDRTLVYGKAGLAAGRFGFSFNLSPPEVANASTTLTGLLLGGGIEYAFAPNWSVKLEYDHVGYLSRTVNLATLSTSESVAVKAGINYKFFGPSGIVVARD